MSQNLSAELHDALYKGDYKKLLEIQSQEPVALIPPLEEGYTKSVDGLGVPAIFTKYVHTLFAAPQFNAIYNQQYLYREQQAEHAYANGDYEAFVFTHEKPYRIEALLEVASVMGIDSFYHLFESVWSNVENIHQFKSELTMMLRHKVLHADEKLRFDPDMELNFDDDGYLTIYRGYCALNGDARGFSYSTDIKKAVWFAKRLSESPAVRELRVKKEDIAFTTDRRSESEVVTLQSLRER